MQRGARGEDSKTAIDPGSVICLLGLFGPEIGSAKNLSDIALAVQGMYNSSAWTCDWSRAPERFLAWLRRSSKSSEVYFRFFEGLSPVKLRSLPNCRPWPGRGRSGSNTEQTPSLSVRELPALSAAGFLSYAVLLVLTASFCLSHPGLGRWLFDVFASPTSRTEMGRSWSLSVGLLS